MMQKYYSLIILCFMVQTIYAQNCNSGTLHKTYPALNSGYTEEMTDNIVPGEYIEVTNVLDNTYTFTSFLVSANDYITLRNATGSTVIHEGPSPLTYAFQASDLEGGDTIRVIIHLDNTCDNTDNGNHTVTLLNETNLPTCFEIENPMVSYLSNTRMDFYWDAPSSGTLPQGYEWEIGTPGFTPGTNNEVVKGTTTTTNATTGEDALEPDTDYEVAIRSDCGSGDYSIWYVTPVITTLSAAPPTNDLCSGAWTVIQETGRANAAAAIGFNGTVLGGAETNRDAEICNGKSANARDDVWYKFLAQTTEVTITLEPMFNGRLSLFSGDCNGLTLLECSDVTNSFSMEEVTHSSLTIGTTYYFRVYSQGFSASDPNFTLKLWSTTGTTDNDGDGYSDHPLVDCNDGDSAINPDATEIAGNDVDENCDGAYLRYLDADGDGYGSNSTVSSSSATPDTNESNNNLDCNDNNAAINPDAAEVVGNNIDENCDGAYLRYVDADGDSYGSNSTVSSSSATPDTNESNNNLDCNDNNAAINPDATEVVGNDMDENCDGNYLRYVDADGDGYGSNSTVSSSSATPAANESNNNIDCDDTDNTVYPGAPELCDGLDNDCINGVPSDEVDTDSDGVLDCDDNCPNHYNPDQNPADADNCESLSVNKETLQQAIVAPNPFVNEFRLHLPKQNNNGIFKVELFDLNGRTIVNVDKTCLNGLIRIDNLNHLLNGMYFLKISNSSEYMVKQLIKF